MKPQQLEGDSEALFAAGGGPPLPAPGGVGISHLESSPYHCKVLKIGAPPLRPAVTSGPRRAGHTPLARGGSGRRRREGRCAATASTGPGLSLHCRVRPPRRGAARPRPSIVRSHYERPGPRRGSWPREQRSRLPASNSRAPPRLPGRARAHPAQRVPSRRGPGGHSVRTAHAARAPASGGGASKGGSKQHPPPPAPLGPGRGRAPPSPTGRGGLGAAGGQARGKREYVKPAAAAQSWTQQRGFWRAVQRRPWASLSLSGPSFQVWKMKWFKE
ncbi:translation initiation factor IF-2 [Sciurus carolinensis]|uniref:translation initiation factor IF-2 n=1 Tax=Sciurus carolinensis TaxID=30640 RepID=UPI001FB53FEA|nr:translation initiation factor IF-2 [Sciurus carolinensis]